MQSITLAQAWPYLAGLFCGLISLVSVFIWRYVDRNDKEHAKLCEENDKRLHELTERNNAQHKEFYERIREMELEHAKIKAEHECNHE